MPWARKDYYNLRGSSHLPGAGRFGPGAFNFKDLSMKRTNPDYFAIGPVRGSSPTASLAADLSQNFHIDMRCVRMCVLALMTANLILESPQLPTPRRSLFTSNLFGTLSRRGKLEAPDGSIRTDTDTLQRTLRHLPFRRPLQEL
jgi:M-phase inducer tyrosine phosphatase